MSRLSKRIDQWIAKKAIRRASKVLAEGANIVVESALTPQRSDRDLWPKECPIVSTEAKVTKSSWKTTLGGVGMITTGITTIIAGLSSDAGLTGEILTVAIGQLVTGIALLFTRDNDVTSKQAGLE